MRSSRACGSSAALTSSSDEPSMIMSGGGKPPSNSRGVPARRSTSSTAITGCEPRSLVRRIRTAGACGSVRGERMEAAGTPDSVVPAAESQVRTSLLRTEPVEYRFLHDLSITQVLHHDPLEELRRYTGVPDAFRVHHHDGAAHAHAQAGRLATFHPPRSEEQS